MFSRKKKTLDPKDFPDPPEFLLDQKNVRILTEDEAEKIFTLSMSKEKEMLIKDSPLMEAGDRALGILLARLKAISVPLELTDFFFIISRLTWVDNPGKIVMLVWICFQHYKKTGNTRFDFNVWCEQLFPWGVPTEEYLEHYWDSQKCKEAPLGNLLDLAETWEL